MKSQCLKSCYSQVKKIYLLLTPYHQVGHLIKDFDFGQAQYPLHKYMATTSNHFLVITMLGNGL